jgi:adenylylsulfate kinase
MTVTAPAYPIEPAHDGARAAGATLWITGLPSAGKSTIAAALAARLRADGVAVEVLDGDEMRAVLSPDLGYSRDDRDTNVARIGWVAARLARHGVLVLAPVVSPYRAARDAVRRTHDQAGIRLLEVHVATPVEVCADRDVKGLYARQRSGGLRGLTGVDGDYEAPTHPELRLDTSDSAVDDAVDRLLALLRKENVL